jgi:hypothetical protein
MGGAVFNMQGQLNITNSTLASNAAVGGQDAVSDRGKGIAGAVFNLSGGFTATGSTFAANTGGFYAAQIYNLVYDRFQARIAQTVLSDTIVADGRGPVDLASNKTQYIVTPPNLGSANADVRQSDLVRTMNAQEGGTITGVPLTAEPLLGPLQDNGGRTPTMALLPGSPAIDIAGSGCPSTDQRGYPRPDIGESACDIGAYEVQDLAAGAGTGSGGSAGALGGGGGVAARGGKPLLPTVNRESLSPSSFPAAPGGPSAVAARRRRYGSKVTYALNGAASVRFTVALGQAGRKAKGGRCVKPTRSNRRAGRCTRYVTLPGSFVRAGQAGGNSFRFTGRLSGRKLTPGSYQLLATPFIGTMSGQAASAPFRIIN